MKYYGVENGFGSECGRDDEVAYPCGWNDDHICVSS